MSYCTLGHFATVLRSGVLAALSGYETRLRNDDELETIPSLFPPKSERLSSFFYLIKVRPFSIKDIYFNENDLHRPEYEQCYLSCFNTDLLLFLNCDGFEV